MTEPTIIGGDEAKEKSAEDLFTQLDSSPKGLSSTEAENRLMQYGLNSLEEKKVNPILKFMKDSIGG